VIFSDRLIKGMKAEKNGIKIKLNIKNDKALYNHFINDAEDYCFRQTK
jgi:hypothetical protein